MVRSSMDLRAATGALIRSVPGRLTACPRRPLAAA